MRLRAITGARILFRLIPMFLRIVSSKSLLSLSKINKFPSSKPTGMALPRISGISKINLFIATAIVYSPATVLLIILKRISGDIHTTMKRIIPTRVAANICFRMYLSRSFIIYNSKSSPR